MRTARTTKTVKISELTTNRLSVYLRCLNELAASGVETVSSQSLAEQFNLNSAQIRKDLAYFGEFGVRGVGYYVDDLRQNLMKILGLTQKHNVAIVGMGNLGLALANYHGFNLDSFEIVALFDDDPAKIGKSTRSGQEILSIEVLPGVIREKEIDIVILAVPAAAAEKVFETVVEAGVRAVLNFAPVHLNPRPGTKVKTVDLTLSLESLSYYLAKPDSDAVKKVDYPDFLRVDGEKNGAPEIK
ncbi:MAG: redox-sensing transcriptional repressor Rex [Acidobacteriota bacterium]|nr:MAG: redox-sensing transcriptional repressor Rex [Acidobacteriota bacterium]